MSRNVLASARRGFKPLRSYPRVSTDPLDIPRTFRSPIRGLDFEWNIRTGKPTIVGFASPELAVSVPFDQGERYLKGFVEAPGKITGHNLTQAEKPILKRHGISLDNSRINDTIIMFWLTNAHLCKSEGKMSDPDSDYKGRGFMNVWTMLSLYTDFPDHKDCPGKTYCVARPCPDHEPFWYNGLDAFEPIYAVPGLQSHMTTRGVDKLYPLHVEFMEFLQEIQERGVRVDREYVRKMRSEFKTEKDKLEESFEFNVKSNPAALEYFRGRGIELEDWTEETVREASERYDDEELDRALEYKELGKGIDSWFADRVWDDKKGNWKGFVDEEGYAHPRLGPYTSTARLQCTGPNLQNVAKRRIDRKTGEKVGKKVRRCVIPYPGHYLMMCDYSNAEGNNMLYQAGEKRPEGDFHEGMVARIGIKATDEFALALGGPRDAAKSATHAWNYLEGLSLIEPAQLHSYKIRSEIAAGARIAYPSWTFEGLVVTFTGINFAQRAFGKATLENRRKVLEMQRGYFEAFPGLHALHKRISKQIENDGAVRPPNTYYLLSYGEAADRLKTGVACYGCLAPETPVLTADLRWVPNADLRAGDQLLTIDEKGTAGRKRKFRHAIVEDIGPVKLPSYRVVTDRGDFIASGEHPWLIYAHGPGNNLDWKPTIRLRIGDKIGYLSEPWKEDRSYEAGYLAAAIDGEGCVVQHRLSYYQNINPMLETFKQFAAKKGFTLNVDRVRHKERPDWNPNIRLSVGNMRETLRFLGSMRPKRINYRPAWEGRTPFGKITDRAEVLKIEFLGERELIGMTTSSHTFIANGMFTHNSQPVAHMTKLAMLNARQDGRILVTLQVHDEIVYNVPRNIPVKTAAKLVQAYQLDVEMPEMPGFRCPGEISWSAKNWTDKEAVWKGGAWVR